MMSAEETIEQLRKKIDSHSVIILKLMEGEKELNDSLASLGVNKKYRIRLEEV